MALDIHAHNGATLAYTVSAGKRQKMHKKRGGQDQTDWNPSPFGHHCFPSGACCSPWPGVIDCPRLSDVLGEMSNTTNSSAHHEEDVEDHQAVVAEDDAAELRAKREDESSADELEVECEEKDCGFPAVAQSPPGLAV